MPAILHVKQVPATQQEPSFFRRLSPLKNTQFDVYKV
jgi:hypothetical protein